MLRKIALAATDQNENESNVKQQSRTAALGGLWNIDRHPVRMLSHKSDTAASGATHMPVHNAHDKTKSTATLKTAKKPLLKHKQHIMLSYSWDYSEPVRQLNAVLQRKGYRTWIDVEQMSKCARCSIGDARQRVQIRRPGGSHQHSITKYS